MVAAPANRCIAGTACCAGIASFEAQVFRHRIVTATRLPSPLVAITKLALKQPRASAKTALLQAPNTY